MAGGDFKVLIAGGGTGGHVIPALAIGRELQARYGAELLFLGTERGLETRLVPEAGFALETVHVGQLKGMSLLARARTLADLPLGVRAAMALLRRFRPDVVVGVGGYASGPGMVAALLLRVPALAYEPNAAPGLANRLIGKYVSAAAVNFPETLRFFRNGTVTGVPVRPEFLSIPARDAAAPPHLLVFGGSQGARALNARMPEVIAPLLAAVPGLTVLHQSGPRQVEETRARFAASGADPARWRVEPFLDKMPARVAEASLLLCRSGATSVAELAAAGRPALLVPFPLAADDHQRKNAEAFARAGAAEVLLEAEMTPERLLERLVALLGEPGRLGTMAANARALSRPEALPTLARMVHDLRRPR